MGVNMLFNRTITAYKSSNMLLKNKFVLKSANNALSEIFEVLNYLFF